VRKTLPGSPTAETPEPKPEVMQVLVLSTAHLQRATAEAMEAHFHNRNKPRKWGDVLEYGYLVWTGSFDDDEPPYIDMPEELAEACVKAKALGCRYILYDQDGPRWDGLSERIYEW